MKAVKDVDEYIANAPKDIHSKLRELRRAIRTAVPKAEESISYGMPYYYYKGLLVYFQLATLAGYSRYERKMKGKVAIPRYHR